LTNFIKEVFRDYLHQKNNTTLRIEDFEISTYSINNKQNAGYKVKFNLRKSLRLIGTMYDIVVSIFNEASIPPFVVCVSGHLGGRGLTLKDSCHKYVLTDQLYDVPDAAISHRRAHYEQVIQAAGRICSVDIESIESIERTIWLTPKAHEYLSQALNFYNDVSRHICENPGKLWTLEELFAVPRNDQIVATTFQENHKITRPKVQTTNINTRIQNASELVIDSSSDGNTPETQYMAVVQVVEKLKKAKVDTILAEFERKKLIFKPDHPNIPEGNERKKCFITASDQFRPSILTACINAYKAKRLRCSDDDPNINSTWFL